MRKKDFSRNSANKRKIQLHSTGMRGIPAHFLYRCGKNNNNYRTAIARLCKKTYLQKSVVPLRALTETYTRHKVKKHLKGNKKARYRRKTSAFVNVILTKRIKRVNIVSGNRET